MNLKSITTGKLMLVVALIALASLARPAAALDQWADTLIDFSSQWSTGSWSAAQTLGPPDTAGYGDISTSWAPAPQNGSLEYITVGYATPVYATGITIRETYGNGFVYQVDVLDTNDVLHTVWSGTDPSATFKITTTPVTSNTSVTISGTYKGVTKSKTITITP